jgi:Ca2+/H+ antiporter
MEIGSAYALQVCLLQIPAMVAFSAWYDPANVGEVAKTFTYVLYLISAPVNSADGIVDLYSPVGTYAVSYSQCF